MSARGNGLAEAAKRWLASGWLEPLHIAKRSLAREMRRAAPRLKGRLLDIGCGVKPYRAMLAGVTHHIGIERPGTRSRSTVVDCWSDALALPFADASFDSVLCNEVLEHVTDPARLFAEAARVLKPGGTLVLSTPQTWGLHEEPHDYWRFTCLGLAHLARGAGLAVEDITPTCGTFATVGQRLASFLFYGTPARRVPVLNLASRPFLAALQLAAVALDELAGRRGDPLDHVLVARR